MQPDASEFVRALSNDGEAVGFIPGSSLGKVLQAWEALHGSQGILRVRLPYEPGRKDRQLAGVLLAALGQPALTRSVPTARAWELVARGCRERGCQLVVVENADLLDRESLVYTSRRYLPGVVLVGGERLGQQIARSAACAGRIVGWASA